MRYILFCLCPLLFFGEVKEDEALFLNRIADFWEEEEYAIAKNQIQEFLSLYPSSTSIEFLNSCLGDLFLREKKYAEALASYSKVTDPKIIERVFPHKLQCLYALKMYENIANECENYLSSNDDLQTRYYLAISLYQQALAEQDKESYITRATPHFEKLFCSPLKTQVAAPYAHLLCLERDFSSAANIYLELGTEESLFQAALIQSEYDKELSLSTFDRIKDSRPEYAYNYLVLSFDLKKHEEIIDHRETILNSIPQNRIPMAHLFFGRSLHAMQRYSESCQETEEYISAQTAPSDTLHSALLVYLDASLQSKNLSSIENGLDKIAHFYPQDEAIFKGRFSKALILLESGLVDQAKVELEMLPKTSEVLLELAFLANQMGDWPQAREYALGVIDQDPTNPLAKKYFLHAVTNIANASVEGKKQTVEDLQRLNDPHCAYFLGKTHFNLKEYQQALPYLLEALSSHSDPNEINLLIALCYRDGFHDLQNFCIYGEKVSERLHNDLYNAYLELADEEKAADHLYAVFKEKAPISTQNLFWLSHRFISQGRPDDAVQILESLLQMERNPEAILALSKLYQQNQRSDDAIAMLQEITDLDEAALLLGELYVAKGKVDEAKEIFAQLYQEPSSLRTYVGASACLQNMRLQNPSEMVLNQYKSMILQKNICFEPLYLEAALDYVALQTNQHGGDLTKKLFLLQKIKKDFENSEDLLSSDYHAARQKLPELDAIYRSYMDFLNAEICETQSLLEENSDERNMLQAKAEEILMKIIEEKRHPALLRRANQCLNH